jgi:hypothetical protein
VLDCKRPITVNCSGAERLVAADAGWVRYPSRPAENVVVCEPARAGLCRAADIAMRSFLSVLAVLSVLCPRARAEPAAAPAAASASAPASTPAEIPATRFAIAVNGPHGWAIGSLGASAYVRLGDHFAVRGNVAAYRDTGPVGEVFAGFSGDDGTGYGGSIFDVGIAGVWYPRRAWDGLLVEAGVLRRARDVYVWPEFQEKTLTRSTEYGGRALIGWSWLIHEHLFIAIAVGLSKGRESGHDTTMVTSRSPMITSTLDRWQTEGEGYMRIGWVFGL